MVSNKKIEMIAITKKFFNNNCAYCGIELKDNKITVDHFIPKAWGGKDNYNNLVPCCSICNQAKADKHPWEWYKKQIFFDFEKWTIILIYLKLNHFKILKRKIGK